MRINTRGEAKLGAASSLSEVNAHFVRLETQRIERETLNPRAALAENSLGREVHMEEDPIRTCFQRDRDRILHSKAFRRLKHKTQVFIAPEGDHYRTRLTHTLDVAQIARTISRALRLNEDLTEAIALGHDVGHPPFGHAGENALDDAIRARDPASVGFRHYEQSLRALTILEPLNLTREVLEGIGGHSKGEKDLTAFDGEAVSTLEAAVVRISDRIAYMNHDLDDAMRSGIISEMPPAFAHLGLTSGPRIGRMVEDVVLNSLNQDAVKLSPQMLECLNKLKDWLFEHVYFRYPVLVPEIDKARGIVRDLFEHFVIAEQLPEGFEGVQGAIDYVAGMTDRFAIREFERLRVPKGFGYSMP